MKALRLAALAGQHGVAHNNIKLCGARSIHQLTSRTLGRREQSRFMSGSASPSYSALKDVLQISDEVSYAIANNKPVVALESTIYTHGALGRDLVKEHDDLVRSSGGIPAVIAIVDGVPRVGVSSEEIQRMIDHEGTVKASRRDISYLVGMVSIH